MVSASGGAQPDIGQALLGIRTLREFRDEAERLFLLRKRAPHD